MISSFLLILLLTLSAPLSADSLSFDVRGSEYFKNSVSEVLSLLPHNYLNFKGEKIFLEEKDLSLELSEFKENPCKSFNEHQLSLVQKGIIYIPKGLTQLAQSGTESPNCSLENFQKILKATLVYEITRIKDKRELISLDPDFQRILGRRKIVTNDKNDRKNLGKELSANTSFLLLDPEYECRRPAMANFLSRKLNIRLRGECQKNYKVLTQSKFLENHYDRAFSIHPDRVYQIHYLFAGKGQSLMSRWGHAMFRLVICAPHRKKAGPECLNDISHHLALSYRAFISDDEINYAKGVFGGYPSQLFIMRYLEVVQEYTKYELRDLYSIPLKIDYLQKKDFIDLILERFWNYQGKYYFLTNNCATETARHLKVVLPEDKSEILGSFTPLKIFKDINKLENTFGSEKADIFSRNELIRKGLLSESIHKQLENNFQFLGEFFPSYKEAKSINRFNKKTKAQSRLSDYHKFFSEIHRHNDFIQEQIIMKVTFLERYLADKFLFDFLNKFKTKLQRGKTDTLKAIMNLEILSFLNLNPWEIVKSDYGIPTAGEFEAQFSQFLTLNKNNFKLKEINQMENFSKLINKEIFIDEYQEYKSIVDINKLISKSLLDFYNRY